MTAFDLDEIQIMTLIASGALEMSMIARMQGENGDAAYFNLISDMARDLYQES